MRAEPRCVVCTLRRGLKEIEEAEASPEVKRAVMAEVLKRVGEGFERGLTPVEIGVDRYETIKKYLDIGKRYTQLKDASQEMAARVLREMKGSLRGLDGEERFHRTIFLATAANAFDFDLLDHSFTVGDFQSFLGDFQLAIDHREGILERVRGNPRILYLLDNAGEVVFDLEFVEALEEMGAMVTLGVKGYRFQNDVTKEDLERWGYLERIGGLLVIDNSLDHLREALKGSNQYDLILSKGMGNFEALEEEIQENIAFAFTVKCLPMADTLKVKQGEGVILLRERDASTLEK